MGSSNGQRTNLGRQFSAAAEQCLRSNALASEQDEQCAGKEERNTAMERVCENRKY